MRSARYIYQKQPFPVPCCRTKDFQNFSYIPLKRRQESLKAKLTDILETPMAILVIHSDLGKPTAQLSMQGMYVIHRKVISSACLLHKIIPTPGSNSIANYYTPSYYTEKKRYFETSKGYLLSIYASGHYQLHPGSPQLIKPSPNYSNLSPP